MMEWVLYACLAIGLLFNFLAVVGLLRFPDVYTRLHAGTKCATFGSIFLSLAVILYGLWRFYDGNEAMAALSIHAFIALVALLLTNPTGAHAIARAAHRSGVVPLQAVVDDLEEHNRQSMPTSQEEKNVE
ncbi:MAG: monovalent cation/H(+) antiporter subunit G [Thermoplasmatota archaeon]